MDLRATAEAILAENDMYGELLELSGDLWQLRGRRGTMAAAAEIQGRPDEATLRQAAQRMSHAIDNPVMGR